MSISDIPLNYHALAIASAFFGALSNILAKTILKDIKAKDVLGINFLMMTGMMTILSPAFFQVNGPLMVVVPIIILISAVDFFANLFFFKAFEKSDVSSATPVLALAPGFTFLFAWVFLGDAATLFQLLMSVGVLVGIILFSTDFSKLKESQDHTLIPALMASVLFGFSAIPSKFLLANGYLNAPTLYELRGGIIGLAAITFFGTGINRLSADHFRKIFIRGVFVIAQWLLLYLALTKGNPGVTYTLANITPVFVFLFGFVFLKEKITLKKGGAAISVMVLSYLIV